MFDKRRKLFHISSFSRTRSELHLSRSIHFNMFWIDLHETHWIFARVSRVISAGLRIGDGESLGGLYPQVTPLTVVKEGPLHLSRIAFLENCVHNWQAEWTWPLGAQNGKHHGYFSLVKRKSEWRTTFFLAFCIRYTYINWSEFLIQLWFAQHQLCNILTPCWCHRGLLTQITLRNGWAWLRRSQ